MTEMTLCCTYHPVDNVRHGSCGQPLVNTEIQVGYTMSGATAATITGVQYLYYSNMLFPMLLFLPVRYNLPLVFP